MSLAIIGQASYSAFTSRTTNTANSFTANTYFSCVNAVTAAAPYLWFRMNETSSTTTTATNNGSSSRAGVYGQSGKTSTTDIACSQDSGRAMRFNGSSGYLSSAQITGSAPNTFTEAIWFKTTTRTGGKLIGLGNTQTGASGVYDRHLYMTNDGRVVFSVYNNAVRTIASADTYRDNIWHQAVATLSTAGMRLYLDGDLVATDPATTAGEAVTSGYIRVGFDNLDGWTDTPTSRYFAGTLDDATFYITALSATEVADQYQAGT